MHPKQAEIYRRMTPTQRVEQAMQLYWTARALKKAWLSQLHPDWDEERLEKEVRRIFLYARS